MLLQVVILESNMWTAGALPAPLGLTINWLKLLQHNHCMLAGTAQTSAEHCTDMVLQLADDASACLAGSCNSF